ncbi:MAG: MsnO8 family LLM class oxidoreductase [Candidatus Nanopelagicales bacterium]
MVRPGVTSSVSLSVLDVIPVRSGQSSAQAVAASIALARVADELGMRRVWYAEHHNMPSVASTSPPVLAAAAAMATERIRVGAGGVMLPNHAPLVVAEQFATIEALAPGRVDLGLGRAPGSDPVITALLRSTGTTSDVERFGDNVADILALLEPEGARLRLTSGKEYRVAATPDGRAAPTVWLLGSSDYSARLAARLGLPFVFANHFGSPGLERALDIYRSGYEPSEAHPAPLTILTANAVVAEAPEEAVERSRPHARAMARMRSGRPMRAAETVDEVLAAPDPELDAFAETLSRGWLVGAPAPVAERIAALAAAHGVDEVMLSPVAGAYAAEPLDAAPGREATLRLLATALR